MKKLTLLCTCLLISLGLALAQSKQVSGTVVDKSGESIIGASVIVKGNAAFGTVTDINGNFNISVPNENPVLQISYVGYAAQEINVSNQSNINVTLLESSTSLDEIVVIGYQSVRRRDLTGAVASVSNKDVNSAPVTNIAQAIQGKLPGVNIISQDGRPDAEIHIRVRGGGSISQSNQPLILIDGIPGTISEIPADMVESIDVLKDASSTAIY